MSMGAFPAFPMQEKSADGSHFHSHPGMSLRDYFAGQALIAVASRWQGTIGDIDGDAMERSAMMAYEIADAMLKERDAI